MGVDIGTSSIKIVELRLDGDTPVLSNYVWATFDDGSISRSDPSASYLGPMVSEYIRKMIKESGIRSKDAYVSIPAFGGLITLIDFPEMPREEMEQAIMFEAHKYIPTSLDDVVISWDIVGKRKGTAVGPATDAAAGKAGNAKGNEVSRGSSDTDQVLLVAASKARVASYEETIRRAGLNIRSIDIETFPLIRSLVGNDPGNFLIIDIGSRACNIVLVEGGNIKVNRNIDAGGRDITRTISKGVQISYERAEGMKVSGRNFFDQTSPFSFSSLESIVGEASRTIRSYYKDKPGESIEAVILSGGTANFSGLAEYFGSKLNARAVIGDPLRRVGCSHDQETSLGASRTRFSIAIGLALKGVAEMLKGGK